MTNPRASKAEDSSDPAKNGFFKKIMNKVSTKKVDKIESNEDNFSSASS